MLYIIWQEYNRKVILDEEQGIYILMKDYKDKLCFSSSLE